MHKFILSGFRYIILFSVFGLFLTGCGLFLTGCSVGKANVPDLEAIYGSGNDSASSDTEVLYRTLYSSEVETLNYLITSSYVDFGICANVVDCLVEYDPYGNVTPSLADFWSSNSDYTVWTFHIRNGVEWVNEQGVPVAEVTADDWVAAAQYVNDAANQSANQYMYSTGSQVKNAQAYYDYTDYMLKSNGGTRRLDTDGTPLEPVDPVSPEDIGVRAITDHLLEYTLERPCPFFLSVLSYSSYMPVNREFLEKEGALFGEGNTHILYNGPFLLTTFNPGESHIMVKNEHYWDKEHVYLDKISQTFHPDASNVQMELYREGKVDSCEISMDKLDEWLLDTALQNEVHAGRPNLTYSYFYCFNYDPNFDEEYEPDNWSRAVMNENFRKSLMYALDRLSLISIYEPYSPELLVNTTICPRNFISAEGLDYTDYPPFSRINFKKFYDAPLAKRYKAKAVQEFKKSGVHLPVKVLMPFNPSITNWENEAYQAKEELESVLGTDYIQVEVLKGPDTSFLSAVRRSGNYAFMKCNWGADYADPQTWTEPFGSGNTYCFWDKAKNFEMRRLFSYWNDLVTQASETQEAEERFNLFAQAEAFLIDHAIVVPFSISQGNSYIASRLNELEGEYAPYGFVQQRLKLLKLHDRSMGIEEFQAQYEEWEKEVQKSIEE